MASGETPSSMMIIELASATSTSEWQGGSPRVGVWWQAILIIASMFYLASHYILIKCETLRVDCLTINRFAICHSYVSTNESIMQGDDN